jgi:hypothetical protein
MSNPRFGNRQVQKRRKRPQDRWPTRTERPIGHVKKRPGPLFCDTGKALRPALPQLQ